MKRPALFPGLIVLGIGIYFLLYQLNIPAMERYLNWPLFLIIVGLAFVISSFSGWDKMMILPGGIILGLGAHFYGLTAIYGWPTHWSMIIGGVGFGFLLTYARTFERAYLFPAGVLLAFPIIILGFRAEALLFDWWPIVLIIVGAYLILKRK